MRGFFKRLFCLHLNWVDIQYISIHFQLWQCPVCGKKKVFPYLNPPVQYLGGHHG